MCKHIRGTAALAFGLVLIGVAVRAAPIRTAIHWRTPRTPNYEILLRGGDSALAETLSEGEELEN